ncbi:MAG TPA: PPOX class F420-dependent oxidoreductase [Actinomycetota bacterium]
MSVFTQAELEYLRGQSLSRVATVGPDGQPHVTPVTFHYNEAEDTIDVGGMFFGGTKKWRDAQGNQHVTILIDDVIPKPRQARAIEVRGTAELHDTGGETANPSFSNFAPQFFRIRPRRIVAWGIEEVAAGTDFQVNARSVR